MSSVFEKLASMAVEHAMAEENIYKTAGGPFLQDPSRGNRGKKFGAGKGQTLDRRDTIHKMVTKGQPQATYREQSRAFNQGNPTIDEQFAKRDQIQSEALKKEVKNKENREAEATAKAQKRETSKQDEQSRKGRAAEKAEKLKAVRDAAAEKQLLDQYRQWNNLDEIVNGTGKGSLLNNPVAAPAAAGKTTVSSPAAGKTPPVEAQTPAKDKDYKDYRDEPFTGYGAGEILKRSKKPLLIGGGVAAGTLAGAAGAGKLLSSKPSSGGGVDVMAPPLADALASADSENPASPATAAGGATPPVVGPVAETKPTAIPSAAATPFYKRPEIMIPAGLGLGLLGTGAYFASRGKKKRRPILVDDE